MSLLGDALVPSVRNRGAVSSVLVPASTVAGGLLGQPVRTSAEAPKEGNSQAPQEVQASKSLEAIATRSKLREALTFLKS